MGLHDLIKRGRMLGRTVASQKGLRQEFPVVKHSVALKVGDAVMISGRPEASVTFSLLEDAILQQVTNRNTTKDLAREGPNSESVNLLL